MTPTSFEDDCEVVVSTLKSALIELFDAGDADPKRPQDIARKFGINKTLTWNICRFLEAETAIEAVSFIPAAGSIARVVESFPESARLMEAKAKVNLAAVGLDAMIAKHADDRSTLELILDNAAGSEEERLELSRRLTFRGNSGICGVQAKTRVSTWFLTPGLTDETKFDLATIRGYVRVRRLRPNVEWPLFTTRAWGPEEDQRQFEEAWEAVDPSGGRGVPLMRNFCRGELPRMDAAETPDGRDYVLRSGAVGNTGAFDCFTGEIMRSAAARYWSEGDEIGELGTTVAMPCESVIVDLLYHRSLDMSKAQALIFGEKFVHGQRAPSEGDGRVLPMRPRLATLAGSPPAVATSLVPQYSEMVLTVFERAKWKPSDFAGLRLEIEFPPMQSQIVIRFPLEKR